MSSAWNSTALVAAVLGAAAGACLLGLPWVPVQQGNPLPAHFTTTDPGFAAIRALLARLDAAIEAADVEAFRGATTPAYVDGLERSLRVLDRRLNRAALRDWAMLRPPDEFTRVADCALRVGNAAGTRACAVFECEPVAGSGTAAGRLVGFALEATAAGLRLDAVRTLQERTAVTAEQLAADLLGNVRP